MFQNSWRTDSNKEIHHPATSFMANKLSEIYRENGNLIGETPATIRDQKLSFETKKKTLIASDWW